MVNVSKMRRCLRPLEENPARVLQATRYDESGIQESESSEAAGRLASLIEEETLALSIKFHTRNALEVKNLDSPVKPGNDGA